MNRRPTHDDLDLLEFALWVAAGSTAVVMLIVLAVLLLPGPLALMLGMIGQAAGLLMLPRYVHWWWRTHSEETPDDITMLTGSCRPSCDDPCGRVMPCSVHRALP